MQKTRSSPGRLDHRVAVTWSKEYGSIASQRPPPASWLSTQGRVLRGGRRFVTTDYVLAETVNLANARSGARIAVRVLELIEQSAGIRIEWIGTSRFDSTKAFFRKNADHQYPFTDCTSFAVMRELKLSQALTTDHHFAQAGFDALLLAASQ